MGHTESQGGGCEVCVVRPMLTITQRNTKYCYYPPHKQAGILETLQAKGKEWCTCSGRCVLSVITKRVPILSWLPAYNLRAYLPGDVVSGMTVAIMHVTQGIGYAQLAKLPPITGMYMAFFPVLIYILLGTSKHSSMGTFAITCLMTGKVVKQFATFPHGHPASDSARNDSDIMTERMYTPNQVAAVVALTTGTIEILLGILNMGSYSVFLSDMMVSGFSTGAAFHVFTLQIQHILGLNLKSYDGPLKLMYTYRDINKQLFTANPVVMVISAITISVIVFNNLIIEPWFHTKTRVPFPIKFIVLTAGTLLSYLFNFHHKYNMRIVGKIPTGLPTPTVPPIELMPKIVTDCAIICVVAFTVSFSKARGFAKRHHYKVDGTQELYALGTSNVVGSFFGCAPIAVSLARSLIQEAAGGKTQITSFVCCSILLLVLLFVGPVFETLPMCVLSSITLVALRGTFRRINDLRNVWPVSKIDAMMWIISFLGVVIVDIDYGLLIGVLTSMLILMGRSQKPKTARLGRVPSTDVYLDVNQYFVTLEIPTVRIFQFCGSLHFANCEYFRQQLISVTGLDPYVIATTKSLEQKYQQMPISCITPSRKGVEYLVIEMSAVSYTDSSGGNLLSQLSKEYQEAGITVCLAALSGMLSGTHSVTNSGMSVLLCL
ncbi:prestin-like isoform X1 [Cherax quadricarinatus]